MAIEIKQLKLADMTQGQAITENWGRPTPYGKRWWDANNRNIENAYNGLAAIVAELEAQQIELAAQQAELEAQQAELEDQQAQITTVVNDLVDVVNFLTYYTNYIDVNIRGWINTYARGGAVASGEVTATTSGGGSPGYINISHGAGIYPTTGAVNVQMKGTSPYCVNIASYDNFTISAYVWDPTTGAGASGVSVTLVWSMWWWAALPSVPVA
jgi:hypothetical protein